MPKWRARKASREVRDTAVTDRKSRRRGERVSVAAKMVRRAADSHDQIAREFELTVIINIASFNTRINRRHASNLFVLLAVFAYILTSFISYTYTIKTYKKQLKYPHRRI
jgi:hypothetical protein